MHKNVLIMQYIHYMTEPSFDICYFSIIYIILSYLLFD